MIRTMLIVLICAGSALSWISVTLEDTWVLPDAETLLGIDIYNDGSMVRVIYVDQFKGVMGSFNPDEGLVVGEMPLDPANTSAWGVAFNDDPVSYLWHTNDWSSSFLYWTDDLSSWSTQSNPAGIDGRGMDYDGTDYWEASGQSVYRFQPGGSFQQIALSEVPSPISGLAVFPYEGETGLVVTCFITMKFYFFHWNGSSMQFLGQVDAPASPWNGYNHGLGYCAFEDVLYWGYYSDGSNDRTIARVSFDITSALENETWAGIKALSVHAFTAGTPSSRRL